MRKITLVLAAGTLILMACSKHEVPEVVESDETVKMPVSCAEYEEMKADGIFLKEDHFATCTCPITCHFDDFK